MTVYVDEIKRWPTQVECFRYGSAHLTADTLDELHAFATKKLRLRREWYQPLSSPHYDLTPANQRKAIQLGAVLVSAREQARKRVAKRWLEKTLVKGVNERRGET